MGSAWERLLDNWQQRPAKEQMILSVLGVLMICALLYLLVFEPIMSWRAQEEKKLVANERLSTQVNSLVERHQARKSSGGNAATEGLAVLVDKSLREYSLSMQGFQPGKKNDARLRLSNVAYQPLTQWLYDLEYRYGISIEELTISQAKAPGLLMASVRLKQ